MTAERGDHERGQMDLIRMARVGAIAGCLAAGGAMGLKLGMISDAAPASAAVQSHTWHTWAGKALPEFQVLNADYDAVKHALSSGTPAQAERAFQNYDVANVIFAGRDDSPGSKTNAAIVALTATGNAWAWYGYFALRNNSDAALNHWKVLQTTMVKNLNALDAAITHHA